MTARLLTGRRNRDHITPVLGSHLWLPVQLRVDFKIELLVFKAMNGLASFNLMLQPEKVLEACVLQIGEPILHPKGSVSLKCSFYTQSCY